MRSQLSILSLGLVAALATPSLAAMVVSGANHNVDFNPEIDVFYNNLAGQYIIDMDLVHDPNAGPMIKHFHLPTTETGDTILLYQDQPHPLKIREDWYIVDADDSATHTVSEPVSDWHEHFITPGFTWVIPGHSEFTDLFPDQPSLITKNGEPHPWWHAPDIALLGRIDVEFPAIEPGNVLDIHKAILWVGTSDNSVWGDNMLDDGTFLDERTIDVWEYPTPEPASAVLLSLGCLAMLRRR